MMGALKSGNRYSTDVSIKLEHFSPLLADTF
jgi:hypothetical protein